jgi:hypothetical protein
MALSSKSLAGPGYIILNIIRVMNIISLLAVVTASIVMLVKTFIVSKVLQDEGSFFYMNTNRFSSSSSTQLAMLSPP